MATRYVRSTDGDNADDGSTWALAKADLAGVAAIDTAGDVIFISDNHAESTAGAVTAAFAGTSASPVLVLCGDDSAGPPTALATTGTITTTGANGITLSGSIYVHGLTFNCGTGASQADLALCASFSVVSFYKNCNFKLETSHASSRILVSSNGSNWNTWKDCGIRFGAAGQAVTCNGASNLIQGGSLLSGGVSPTFVFALGQGVLIVEGFDFSAGAAGMHLTNGFNGTAIFRNCKLPASWSGSLTSAQPGSGSRCEMWNCDSADTNYKLWIETIAGSIKDETTLVKTGGASDGDTPLSWKMATSADAEYPLHVLRSPEIFSERITSVGSAKTITIDIAHNLAAPLKDDEIWVEVQYLGQPGSPQQWLPSSFISDAKADVLAAAADQASSSATWADGSPPTSTKQKLEVTFTPQAEGVAICTVCMAKASSTVYVDPVAQIT